MLLMTIDTGNRVVTLDYYGRDYWVTWHTLDGQALGGRWCNTLEAAVDVMPMMAVGEYVPYKTKRECTWT